MNTLHFKTMGPKTVLIEWPKVISPAIHNELLAFRKLLKLFSEHIQETVISYNAICLYLNESVNATDLIQKIKATISLDTIKPYNSKVLWQIPVCYHESFAPDMQRIVAHTGLTPAQIVTKHTTERYRLYFCGFLPGFIYLGGLNELIATPRLESPRREVPQGAVGIAGMQTGIYPRESPGGWNLIGRCPLAIFNPKNSEKPSPFNAGQQLKFYSISKLEYKRIADQARAGTYTIKTTQLDD